MPRLPTLGLALLLTSLLTGAALAQPAPPLAPPSGPVAQAGVDDGARQRGPGDRAARGARGGQRRLPPALRQMLIQRFDQNGDGRLTGPERMRAKRFVQRHRAQLQDGRDGRGARGGQGARGAR